MLDRIKAAFVGSATQLATFTTALVPQYLRNLLWLISATYAKLAREAYKTNGVVYACMRVLMSAVAEPPLLVETTPADPNATPTPLPEHHPLVQLVRQPNELTSENLFWKITELYCGLGGRAVWWKERDNKGDIIALWPLRPDRVGPIYGDSTKAGEKVLWGWSYQVPGTGIYAPIPRRDSLYFLDPDPEGESGGMAEGYGWVQALAREVGADNEATLFVGSMLRNYATPGVILKTKANIRDKETATKIKMAYASQFGGENRGLPAIVDGETEVTEVGFNMRELEFPDLRKHSESRICAAAGVPAILVGVLVGLEAGIRATIREQREYFAETTLSNKWRSYEDAFNGQVCAEFGPGLRARFDRTKVRALNEVTRNEVLPLATAFVQGSVTVNEYRTKVLNLPDLGPAGDVLMVPNTVTPVPKGELADPPEPTIVQLPAPPQQQALPAGKPDAAKPEAKPVAEANPNAAKPQTDGNSTATKAWSPEQRKARLSMRHAGAVHAALQAQKKAILARAGVKAQVGDWTLDGDETEALSALLQEQHAATVALAWDDAGDRYGIGVAFDVANPHVRGVLDKLAVNIRRINDETRDAVRGLVDTANEEGWTDGELADRLGADYAFSDARAATIARTETGQAYNLGSVAAYRDSGQVEGVDVVDGDDDDPCAEANGAFWTLEEADDNPLEHPNCLTGDTPVRSLGVRAGYARRYEGEVVVVQTAAGRRLRITPNHAVLTAQGWTPAGELAEGIDLLCVPPERWAGLARLAGRHDAEHDQEAPIRQVAQAVELGRLEVARQSAADFHGDGTDHEVYVVRANRPLLKDRVSEGAQLVRESMFAGAGVQEPVLAGHGARSLAGLGVNAATPGVVGGGQRVEVRAAQGVDGMPVAQIDAAFLEACAHHGIADPEGSGDTHGGLAGLVTRDQIVHVDRLAFSGHVYNLETEGNWYAASGVIVHNCTRAFIPRLIEAGDEEEPDEA